MWLRMGVRMIEYPSFTVKVTIQTHYKLTAHHDGLSEDHIVPSMKALTEIDAVKAVIDALRVRYYELERDEEI
jgi:hypothetical protein